MSNSIEKQSDFSLVSIREVEDKITTIRGMKIIADADVAALYGVQTGDVNRAVRNNPDKFPSIYMFELSISELQGLRRKSSSTKLCHLPCATQKGDFWTSTPKNARVRVHFRLKTDADPL